MRQFKSVPLTELVEIHDYLREPVNATERNKKVGVYPYFGATGQVGWIDGYRQDGEYVLLGEDGAPFLDPNKQKAYLVNGKCWVNNHAHVLRGKNGICDNQYLCYALNAADYSNAVSGSTRLKLPQNLMDRVLIPAPSIEIQHQIAAKLKAQFAEVENARNALECQKQEILNLANAYIRESIEQSPNTVGAGLARDLNGTVTDSRARPAPTFETRLGDVLEEVKKGIGPNWADYPVLGATRNGLAPAKEPPGKYPQRYKPVFSGTVFYNPMRIMIGSIAFVDDGDEPGITSPDYVALRGKSGVVDSCWFYYWLRSPYGVQCINALARGAVRERMLFNRLAEGSILLPPYEEQLRVSKALAQLKSVKSGIQKQLDELNKIPERLLAQAFGNND